MSSTIHLVPHISTSLSHSVRTFSTSNPLVPAPMCGVAHVYLLHLVLHRMLHHQILSFNFTLYFPFLVLRRISALGNTIRLFQFCKCFTHCHCNMNPLRTLNSHCFVLPSTVQRHTLSQYRLCSFLLPTWLPLALCAYKWHECAKKNVHQSKCLKAPQLVIFYLQGLQLEGCRYTGLCNKIISPLLPTHKFCCVIIYNWQMLNRPIQMYNRFQTFGHYTCKRWNLA